MTEFWNYQFKDSVDFVETYDELPLWSAPFGNLLLKHIDLQHHLTVLDIGSGTGFPLFELAQRLGDTCKCYGLDPWTNANNRAKKKIINYGVSNVEVIKASADRIPFDDASVDLIVSNLGINNFDNPDNVFNECKRVLKKNGKLALTTNLNGHWIEFYKLFEETLIQLNETDILKNLQEQQMRRGTVDTISKLFTNNGFKISKQVEDKFEMRFLNGSAFLNHYFIKLGWLSSWQSIIQQNKWPHIFKQLEENLNKFAHAKGELKLTVPMAFIEGQKL